MNQSTLKTKMRRAGFRCSPYISHIWRSDGTTSKDLFRQAWRKHWKYCKGFGRHFRVRWHAGVVDVGEAYETFDRWANSTERTLTVEEFVKEFLCPSTRARGQA